MKFSRAHFLVLVSLLLIGTGCRRAISDEERAARSQLRTALHERAFARAIPLARKVLRFAPNDNGSWARLAQAQYGNRDLTGLRKTLAEWQRGVKKTSAKYDEYRGDLARAEGRPADALAAWTESVAAKDRKLRVFIKIARLEQKAGHWAEAASAWTRGMKDHPTAPALINRAICYRRLHSWDAALADVRQAARLAPQDPVVREEHALLDRLGKFLAEVRDLDRDLAALPQDASLLADRALLFLRAGDATLAFDDASKAAQFSPRAVRPKLFRALAAHQLGQKASETATSDAVRLESLSSDFLQTISRLDAEIEAEPKSAELLTSRAWQLNEIGQPRLALADAEAALRAEAKSAGACAEASYALAKLNRSSDAYGRIKQATELDPNFSTAWQYRGELEMKQSDYVAAIDSLTRALAINQTAAALGKREECYRKLGLAVKADDDHRTLEQLSATQ